MNMTVPQHSTLVGISGQLSGTLTCMTPDDQCPVHRKSIAEKWVIAKQEAVLIERMDRPLQGYTVLRGMPLYDTFDLAASEIERLELPLGWVAIQVGHLFR